MKKIITFAIVLGVLTGGIIFYSMRKLEDESLAVSPKSLPAEISVHHGSWDDILVPDKEPSRVYRKSNQDMATVIDLSDDTIVVDWDNWGIETFKKDESNVWNRTENNFE